MSESSRLRWLCRRGMKELDVLLTAYLDRCYENASTDDQHHFKSLLEWPDPDLYAVLIGRETVPDSTLDGFVRKLRELEQNR